MDAPTAITLTVGIWGGIVLWKFLTPERLKAISPGIGSFIVAALVVACLVVGYLFVSPYLPNLPSNLSSQSINNFLLLLILIVLVLKR